MFVMQDADAVADKASIYAEVCGIGTAFDPAVVDDLTANRANK